MVTPCSPQSRFILAVTHMTVQALQLVLLLSCQSLSVRVVCDCCDFDGWNVTSHAAGSVSVSCHPTHNTDWKPSH